MRYLITVILLSLTGCMAIPVTRHMPQLPPSLQTPCKELDQLPRNTDKLSVVLRSVTTNYNHYHECAIKLEMLQMWYQEQKEIFESIK